MGRAVLKVADALVGVMLRDGIRSIAPVEPLRNVKVIDARMREWRIELLLEGPDLAGASSASFDDAPAVESTWRRLPALEGEALIETIADHLRNSGSECRCTGAGAPLDPCPACRSRAALRRIPYELMQQARAFRRAAGEEEPTTPAATAADDERHGEVPGA